MSVVLNRTVAPLLSVWMVPVAPLGRCPPRRAGLRCRRRIVAAEEVNALWGDVIPPRPTLGAAVANAIPARPQRTPSCRGSGFLSAGSVPLPRGLDAARAYGISRDMPSISAQAILLETVFGAVSGRLEL
jgi:hypothetical protein